VAGKPPLAEWPAVPGLRLGRPDHGPQGRLLPLPPVQGGLHGSHRHRDGAVAYPAAQVGLHDVPAYLLVTARKGISSLQLAKEIGITQKSAWFLLHRLREACGSKFEKLAGIIEIDETYVGGIEANKHKTKKLNAGRGAVGKTAVLGMRERASGKVKAKPVANTDQETIHRAVHENIEVRSTLHTDEFAAYRGLAGLFFDHATINHGAGEFVRGDVTTNGIESVFAVMTRGILGVYHHASPKHLGRYVDEFAFRLNEGNVKLHTLTRLASFVDGTAGKRLTYKALIA
jgi:transposase-like protein